MKKLLLLIITVAIAVSAFADGPVEIRGYEEEDYKVYKEEAAVILEAAGNSPIGEFTLIEMKEVALDLSIPFQKMQYVKKSKTASAIIPGLGQFMNDDPASGTFFLLTDISVITGTLIGAYHMLPDELKFDNLNYYSDSHSKITDRWESQSFEDMLPTMGVLAGGVVVSAVIRMLSASHAGKLAQKNIAEGKIKFDPKLILPAFDSSEDNESGSSGFGLGVGMSF